MIYGELSVNPGLRKTSIRFNGKAPGLSSAAELYCSLPLQVWMDQLPDLFSKELNGLDFDLYFTGPELDFQEIRSVFADRNISEKDVRLIHQTRTESRLEKLQRIEHLLEWLKDHPTDLFDPVQFIEENWLILNREISGILLGADFSENVSLSFLGQTIVFDKFLSADDLSEIDLRFTPIVLSVGLNERDFLYQQVQALLKREDVREEQLFFLFDQSAKKSEEVFRGLKRGIEDLGISQLQILNSLNDSSLERYIEVFPITENIVERIALLDKKLQEIGSVLDEKNRISAAKNRDLYSRLESVQTDISKEKELLYWLESPVPISFPAELKEKHEWAEWMINGWQKRRSKVTDDKPILEYSVDLQRTVQEFCEIYQEGYIKAVRSGMESIVNTLKEKTEADGLNRIKLAKIEDPTVIFPQVDIRSRLLATTRTQTVQQKDDLFSMLMRQGQPASPETYEQSYCVLSQWRTIALEAIEKMMRQCEEAGTQALISLRNDSTAACNQVVEQNLAALFEEKERLESALSGEEKSLQSLNEWRTAFEDEMIRIREVRYE